MLIARMLTIKKFLVVLVFAVALSGCIPSVITNSEKEAAKNEFTKGGAPLNFPPLPFYTGAKVLEGYGSNSTSGWGLSAITTDELEKVVKFFNENLTIAGWEYNTIHKDVATYVFEVKNSQYEGEIIVNTAADSKKTGITYSVSKR